MLNIFLFGYNIILFIFLILTFPFIWKRIKPDIKYPGDWKERFGIYKKDVVAQMKKKKNIWIHTVSIGEFLSVLPLISNLQKQNNIVVTLTTKTGREVASKHFPNGTHLFFPADFYPVMLKTIRKINPKLIVIVETEIWPNLLKIASDKKIPIVLINGRISPSSFSMYKKHKFFISRFLNLFSTITMRNLFEADRISSIGAPRDKIQIVGSMKFDLAYTMSKNIQPQQIRDKYNIPHNKKVIVFGSIHPAEETSIIEISEKILHNFKDTIIIIVPRYLDKTKVHHILSEKKIPYKRKSQLKTDEPFSILIVDTYGELNNFYSICDITFVGASLTPWGGQNPIEPTAFKKPILFGKYNWHFLEEWRLIKEGGGGIEVDSFSSLYNELVTLLKNPHLSEEIGKKGYQTLKENIGATQRNLQIISKYL